MFSELPQTIKIEPIKAKRHLGSIGFSEVGQIGRTAAAKSDSEVLLSYQPVNRKAVSKQENDDNHSHAENHKNSKQSLLEYMDWMKNLALFHQMREKVEESRAKEKMDDYKMQIVRSLMQKNRMLEEIERKLTNREDRSDPLEQQMIERVTALEKTVVGKASLGQSRGNSQESKVDQMMDFMMHNMSSLQQMMFSVSQMQKTQYQYAQETNKMIQSIPQVVSNLLYQSGIDKTKSGGNKNAKVVASHLDLGRKAKGKTRQDDSKHIDISRISSINGDHNQKKKDVKSNLKNDNLKRDFKKTDEPNREKKDSELSDDDLLSNNSKQRRNNKGPIASNQKMILKADNKDLNKHPKLGPGVDPSLRKIDHGRSGNSNNTKTKPKPGLEDGISVNRQETPIKNNAEGEDDTSEHELSIKTDSIALKDKASQQNKTILKDDSVVLSEGGGQQNMSLLNKSKNTRNLTRRKTDQGEGRHDQSILTLLANKKSDKNLGAADH